MSWALLRRGATGVLHVARPAAQGRWHPICGRTAPAGVIIWRRPEHIRALWLDDEARRCLDCSRKVSAAH